jgi:hypothetical protein
MKKIYTEIGYGNQTFFSTEIEEGDNEYRVPKFILPKKIDGLYLRLWICKKVYIISTDQGIKTAVRSRSKLKILVGVSGINLRQNKI